MDINDIKKQATELTDKLIHENGIHLQRTAALDLICAVHGYKNRHLVVTSALRRPDRPNLAYLEHVSQRVAGHDDRRRQQAIEATLAVTYPQRPSTVTVEYEGGGYCWHASHKDFEIPVADLAHPTRYLTSPAGKAFLKDLAGNTTYRRYRRHGNDPGPSKESANEVTSRIIKAIEQGDHADNALEEFYGYGLNVQDVIDEEFGPVLDHLIENLAEEATQAGTDLDAKTLHDWRRMIEEELAEALEDNDDSSVKDILSNNDTVEMVFFFQEPGTYIEDEMVWSHKPWSQTSELRLDGSLQHALASLGYTLGEFRRHFRNAHEPHNLRRVKRRRPPVVTLDQIEEMIDNACSRHFQFVWYGIVPLTDLLELRKGTRLKLTGGVIGTYDPFNGAFHDTGKITELVVSPSEGMLRGCHPWPSPDDICGLVRGYYQASVTVVSAEDPSATPS